MTQRIFPVLMFIIALTAMVQAQTPEEEIKTLLKERDEQVKTLLGPEGSEYSNEQRAEIKDIINGIIDFESMARYALEDTYDTLSTEIQSEFVELFATIVRDQSLNKLDIYRAEVTYNSITVDGNEATVKTFAELDDIRTPVDYTLVKESGEWVITDLILDEVSTAESYNRQFQRIIKRKGFDSLLNTLRKRAARS
ncbi:MAG: ABC transporter substrate-binding protein [Balneola sp.]|nr:ABC transporter substrate-binding protein [Balneola sp.]MBO6651554.1 ABC transporter substrate-binding protein [Balneola sp.]MBO6710907.1 ABC transporter substrate-binding protein [Balneola sp.]MBO6799595.1 ABC transporter substrate-binding protein [Balneola sp.]MBO6870327.1 ABC transporter substrate-binding protein [Balneola sp.]